MSAAIETARRMNGNAERPRLAHAGVIRATGKQAAAKFRLSQAEAELALRRQTLEDARERRRAAMAGGAVVAFNLDDLRFGNPLKRDELTIEDDRDITLTELDLEHRERFTYGYHFGEGWQIDIKVEKTGPVEKGHFYPVCIAGERAGPPEDCGGIEAFHDMLACIKEPNTDLGREWLEWLGPDYDPESCDLGKINKALKKLGK